LYRKVADKEVTSVHKIMLKNIEFGLHPIGEKKTGA
jgi:hypothetical protein